jgi:hypothetical protein
MSVPDLSDVIPASRRGELIRYAFENPRRVSASLGANTTLVEDSSNVSFTDNQSSFRPTAPQAVRQGNHGLLFACRTVFASAARRES